MRGRANHVDGRTVLPGLYAGAKRVRAACANRLASNSLLEGLVCAHRAAQSVLTEPQPAVDVALPEWHSGARKIRMNRGGQP